MTSDYTTTGGGLKLKGGISKPTKKKKRRIATDTLVAEDALEKAASPTPKIGDNVTNSDGAGAKTDNDETSRVGAQQQQQESQKPHETGSEALTRALEQEDSALRREEAQPESEGYVKTEAQLRHEERRRKMFLERLQKEGVKTHKERVEALNTYLSGLSEHHDMPRIGPG